MMAKDILVIQKHYSGHRKGIFGQTYVLKLTSGARSEVCQQRGNPVPANRAPLRTIYNMSGRDVSDIQTFVYPIQHGRECCKWLKKRLIL
jgi:hypothetical protein